QADIELTWGDGGTIASVREITSHLNVPFAETPQASYGFVPDADGNGKIDWIDINFVEEVSQAVATTTLCTGGTPAPLPDLALPAPGAGAKLTPTAVVTPVSTTSGTTDPAGMVTT